MNATEKNYSGTVLLVYDERSYFETLTIEKEGLGYHLASRTVDVYDRVNQISEIKQNSFIKIRSRGESFYLNTNLIKDVMSAKDDLGNKSCKIALKVPGLDSISAPIEYFDNLKRFVKTK